MPHFDLESSKTRKTLGLPRSFNLKWVCNILVIDQMIVWLVLVKKV